MIHSARPTVSPVATIVFCCFVLLDLKSGDGRTDNMCRNNYHYQPGLWVGLVDQLWIILNWFDLLSIYIFFSATPVPQPDNAEYLLNPSLATVEACLSINNNWYGDGITWHDTACYRKKPFMCEDSDVLIRRARALNPTSFLWSNLL